MPQRFGPLSTPSAPASGGGRFGPLSAVPDTTVPVDVPTPDETADSGYGGVLAALAGALGLAGAAYLTKGKPGVVSNVLGRANALRQQLMLSGMAAPKSALGNIGAAGIASAERGSMAPLKALFSGQTIKDAAAAFKANRGPTDLGGTSLPGPLGLPGRIMGSLDEATRNALQRGGLSVEEAERAVLQSPLAGERFGKFGNVMQSPAANYIFPFRRTPFNQLYEGLDILKHPGANPKTLGAVSAVGALHGAATADDKYPVSVPLGIAAASRYGLPYGLAALAGRAIAGGRADNSGIGSAVLPVSEYGVETVTNPLSAVRSPAALRALRNLGVVDNPNLW